MSDRAALHAFYVLHTRPFRSTSLIVDLFSREHGRLHAIAKSARGPKSRYKGMLQPFTPLLGNWAGKHELKHLNQVELGGMIRQPTGNLLAAAFYLNELLMFFLQMHDAHEQLYDIYDQTLQGLSEQQIKITLRVFEKRLLEEMGYGLPLSVDCQHHVPVVREGQYRYLPGTGFTRVEDAASDAGCYPGALLLDLYEERFDNPETTAGIQHLLRETLQYTMHGKTIHSRALISR